MKKLFALIVLATLFVGACGPTETPTPEVIIVVVTATPVPATSTPITPMDLQITECGYGEKFGFVTMAGTVTNNTSKGITFLRAAVALIKNGQVVRVDEIPIICPGKSSSILYGMDQECLHGLEAGATKAWSVVYFLTKLTQPFECEVSITSCK